MENKKTNSSKNKSLKNNKKGIIIGISVFFVILIIFFIIFFIMPSFSTNKYGNRLDDIKNHKISSETISTIKKEIAEEDGVKNITYNKEGKILNFVITFDDGYNIDSAKTTAEKVIEKISKKSLKYYDVQIFLQAKSDGFPNIGYRSKGSDSIKWGNVGDSRE